MPITASSTDLIKFPFDYTAFHDFTHTVRLWQVAPRLLVYGYGHRDSPRLQAALSAAILAAAAGAPNTAAAAIDALVAAERALAGAAKTGFVALEESPPLLVAVLARGAATRSTGWAAITAAARGFRAIVERTQVRRCRVYESRR